MNLLITGGAGFIGSAVLRNIIAQSQWRVLNYDKLTYAGNLESLAELSKSPNYAFEQGDICDRSHLATVFRNFRPTAIMHLAAESHVDRSIDGPGAFISSNIVGTYTFLEEAKSYWSLLPFEQQRSFRFHHISTDEVYGSLGETDLFTEATPYAPNSPYSASKAASDHLVRAWQHTYGFPTLTTNCSNNYGPYQFPEKLIPLVILNALAGKALPIYGKGENIRDWLYVDDHANALLRVLSHGVVGETYNVGGDNEQTNIAVVQHICDILDDIKPDPLGPRRRLITHVADRPGHDYRYAIDAGKIKRELGWQPQETFATGLRRTVAWYMENANGWCRRVQDGSYRGERLGFKN